MTLAGKNLFISLLRDGRTVSRSEVKGRNIYTGRDWKCHLVDPKNPNSRQKLMVRTMGGYRINLPKDAGGAFIYEGSTIALKDMVAWGLARKSNDGYLIQHRDGMSARIHIGDTTYLLDYDQAKVPEMVPEPVRHSHLPLKYRFQPPNRTDMTFLTLLVLILLVHISGVRTLMKYPIPEITAIKELPRRISRLILEPAVPTPAQTVRKGEPGVESEKSGSGLESVQEQVTEKPIPEKVKPSEDISPAPKTREAIRSQVSKIGVVGVLTGRGTAGRKTAGTGISILQLDAKLQQDLESVLGEISGISTNAAISGTVGDTGFGGTQPGSGLIGIEGRLNDANVSGPVQVSSFQTAGGRPKGSATGELNGSPEEKYVAPEHMEERSARTISRVVAAHTGAIRYAYNRELRKKPSLRGKIVLTFTISPSGTVTECHIEESAMKWPPLENSLVKMVKTWKFPEIPEGNVTVSYPLVFFPSM